MNTLAVTVMCYGPVYTIHWTLALVFSLFSSLLSRFSRFRSHSLIFSSHINLLSFTQPLFLSLSHSLRSSLSLISPVCLSFTYSLNHSLSLTLSHFVSHSLTQPLFFTHSRLSLNHSVSLFQPLSPSLSLLTYTRCRLCLATPSIHTRQQMVKLPANDHTW